MPGTSQWFSILAGVALKSTVVLGAAWLIAFALRRRSAAARHMVWTAAAAAVLAMPLLAIVLPALRVPASSALFPFDTGLVFRVSSTAASGISATISAPAAAPAGTPAPLPWRPALGTTLMLAWAAGAAIMWLQMIVAYARLRRVRGAAPLITVHEGVPVLETAPGGMPMAFGIRTPAILMPADAAEWSEERRAIVLAHELAHVRRGDAATHLLARGALSLNWWNPLAWIAWREFLKERERAADDLVLNAGARPSDYAGHLLEVARSMQTTRPTAWAAVAMARRSQIEGRLLAILDSGVNRKEAGRAALTAAMFLAVVLSAPFAAMRAQNAQAQTPPEADATIRTAIAQQNPEMLEQAAAAYEKLQKYDVAQSLLESALAIRGQVSGTQSAPYAAELVKLGDISLKRRNIGTAEDYYTKAIGLGDRPEVVPALLYMGKSYYERNNGRAQDLLQRALNTDPAGPLAGQALTWLAMLKQNTRDGAADAESLYQRALAVETPNSRDAGMTMELYARFLRQQNRPDEAQPIEARAREIRQTYYKTNLNNDVKGMLQSAELPAGVYRVGGGVTAPRLIYKIEPSYTQEARAAKLQGPVILYAEIGPDGIARNIAVKQALGLGLDEQAIEAISQWQFAPGTKDGQPVTVAATIEVNFRLM